MTLKEQLFQDLNPNSKLVEISSIKVHSDNFYCQNDDGEHVTFQADGKNNSYKLMMSIKEAQEEYYIYDLPQEFILELKEWKYDPSFIMGMFLENIDKVELIEP